MNIVNTNKTKFIVAILISICCTSPVALADGGGSTGGGLGDNKTGDLLDFYETQIDPHFGLKKINPMSYRSFHERLMPQIRELHTKLPRVARDMMRTMQRLEWYVTDLPIAESNDECALLKVNRIQIAKQVGNRVVISRKWLEQAEANPSHQAGLFAHEILTGMSRKNAGDCSTNIRNQVRAVFEAKEKSAEELKSAFIFPGSPYGHRNRYMTAFEMRNAQSVFAKTLTQACVNDVGVYRAIEFLPAVYEAAELEKIYLVYEELARGPFTIEDLSLRRETGYLTKKGTLKFQLGDRFNEPRGHYCFQELKKFDGLINPALPTTDRLDLISTQAEFNRSDTKPIEEQLIKNETGSFRVIPAK